MLPPLSSILQGGSEIKSNKKWRLKNQTPLSLLQLIINGISFRVKDVNQTF